MDILQLDSTLERAGEDISVTRRRDDSEGGADFIQIKLKGASGWQKLWQLRRRAVAEADLSQVQDERGDRLASL